MNLLPFRRRRSFTIRLQRCTYILLLFSFFFASEATRAGAGHSTGRTPELNGSYHPYDRILPLAVRFYGAQRCGKGPNWLLRNNPYGQTCHLQDGPAHRPDLDLTGGWHDAGDHIKFTLTNAWAAYLLLKAYAAFPNSFADKNNTRDSGKPDGIPDVLNQVRYAADYLMRCAPDDNTAIARVGGDQDHKFWATAPKQSQQTVARGGGRRPVYAGARADICGMAAAALALMSRVYQEIDAVYAARALYFARRFYSLAQDRPGITKGSFYQDQTWQDDLLCAAAELYLATDETVFLDDAIALESKLTAHGWVADWGNHLDFGRHSLARAGHQPALRDWQADVDSYLEKISGKRYVRGLAFFGDWGSLRYAMNAVFSAALLFDMTNEGKYRQFALSQLQYVLGENEYDRSFVIGYGKNPPRNPHHQNAYGHDPANGDLSQPPLHVLAGALVGGPSSKRVDVSQAGYQDNINDYVGNEVSIGYNAGFVGTLAFAVRGSGLAMTVDAPPGAKKIKLLVPEKPDRLGMMQVNYWLSEQGKVWLELYDAMGGLVRRLVHHEKVAGVHQERLQTRGLAAGSYILQLQSAGEKRVQRIIIQTQ